MNGKWVLPLGILLLLAIATVARRHSPMGDRPPKRGPIARWIPDRTVEATPPAAEMPPAAAESAQRRTAQFLEFDEATMAAFEATRQRVRSELESIQREMRRIFDAYPADLSDEVLQRIQSDAQRQFEEERQLALAQFEPFLGTSEHHRRFREVLEAWTMAGGDFSEFE